MARDFLSDTIEEESDSMPGRDFLEEMKPSEESFGASLAKAIPRIGEDIYRGGMHAIKSIPGYYESAKTEIPGVVQTMQQHPANALGQGMAGVAEMGKNIFNTPHDIINYLTKRLNLFPENWNEKVQMGRMPEDTQQMINKTFGEPQHPGEALIRGAGRNALNLLGGAGLAKTLNPMQLTSKNIAKDIVKTRQAMREKYSGPKGLYTNLFNEARQKGLGQVKFDPKKVDINLINEYAPDKYTKALGEFLQNNDIELAQRAQSDLKKYLNKMEKRDSIPSPEKKSIRAAEEAQKHLSDAMFEGNPKLKKKYNKITSGYGKEVIPYTTNKAINQFMKGDLVADELVPRLQRGKFKAKRGEAHPALKWRKRVIPLVGGAGAIGGGSALYNYLTGNPFSER